MRVVDPATMRAIDDAAVVRDGADALMQRAGAAIARVAAEIAREGPLVGIAGPGNNGGDAFAALAQIEGRARICFHDPSHDGSEARRAARERAWRNGVELRPFPPDASTVRRAGLILDGIFGVAQRAPLDSANAALVAALGATDAPVLALDVPTGLDPATGALTEPHVRATATIALGRPKLGCFLDPGRDATGALWCAPIGMRDADAPDALTYEVMTGSEFAAVLPRRADESEKRSAGAPLIVAGSTQFPGAGVLCALGAARAGAGYVTVAAPAGAAAAMRAHLIEQVVLTYDENDPAAATATILEASRHCGSIAIGPGLGLSDAYTAIVNDVVTTTELPVVADAGALFHFAKRLEALRGRRLVITPHAGEFARLSGGGTVAAHERLTRIRAFVDRTGITTLLKGRVTLVADARRVALNPTGTPALATAGTGDVLTGIIATLLAQGLEPYDAARTGAFWHGRAAHLAAASRPVGVIARDVADALGAATVIATADDELVRVW